MRLNLGCGPGPIRDLSYIHIDASRKLLIAKIPVLGSLINKGKADGDIWDKRVKFRNITRIRLEPLTIESVYSSHLLEHLYYEDSIQLLKRIYIALENGGRIRLALPDYDAFISIFQSNYLESPMRANLEFEAALLSHPKKRPTHINRLWTSITGNLHVHRWHPNFSLLEKILADIGFVDIRKCDFQDSKMSNIQLLENRSQETFFIEAVKKSRI
jgi:predicted SAM-dependent methyltransferase